MSKHIMFSYQWNCERLVSKVYHHLSAVQSIPLWMDRHGGMTEYLSTSMADGVENCCVLICFLTPEYQESSNCKKELMYAVNLRKPIIPCLVGSSDDNIKWKPTSWLGITITDMVYLNFAKINDENFPMKCRELLDRIDSILGVENSESSPIETVTKEIVDHPSIVILPESREGPEINQRTSSVPNTYSCEGDSAIRLMNRSTNVDCKQDLYSRDGRFFQYLTFPQILFYNTTSEPITILELNSEYETFENDEQHWVPCQIVTDTSNGLIHLNGHQAALHSATIKIQLEGLPGVDNERRARVHRSLPQPLRIRIRLIDIQAKQTSLIVEQINKPINLPTLEKLIAKIKIEPSNILDYVYADDCNIDVRYFVLIHHALDSEQTRIIFSFGCDLIGLRSPSWNKEQVDILQKSVKQRNQTACIVHENVFDPFFRCIALFNHDFHLDAVQIEIKTTTSTTIKKVLLPIQMIFP